MKLSETDSPIKLILSRKYRRSFYVLICILLANIAYYFARVNWNVASGELKVLGVIKNASFSDLMSATYAANFISKLIGGYLCDAFPRPSLVLQSSLVLCCVSAFAATFFDDATPICIFWVTARFFSSLGKMGLIRIVSDYYPAAVLGTVIALTSVSGNIGESLSKIVLGSSLEIFSWKQMLNLSVGIAIALIIPTMIFARDSKKPHSFDVVDIKTNDSAFASNDKKDSTPSSPPHSIPIKKSFLVKTYRLLTNTRMILLILLNLAITCICEIIGGWSHFMMMDVLDISSGTSSSLTGLFCAFAAIGSLTGGRLIDSVPRRHRLLVNAICMALITLLVMIVYMIINNAINISDDNIKRVLCVVILSFIEFFIGPPASYIDGIFVVDSVPHDEIAFASAIVGSSGYIASISQNFLIKGWTMEDDKQWHLVYLWLVAVGVLSIIISLAFWYIDLKEIKVEKEAEDQS